jgi:putative transposase
MYSKNQGQTLVFVYKKPKKGSPFRSLLQSVSAYPQKRVALFCKSNILLSMAVRKIPFLIGEYYHIYNRGVDKRIIFSDKFDYKRFILLLFLCNGENSVNISKLIEKKLSFSEIFNIDRGKQFVDIGAYCLMPNHFHILVRERIEGGISMFMEKLATAYAMYFNTKNDRKGSLFEGPFGAKHIDTDEYLNWVFSYIHLNPVKLIYSDWKEKGIPDTASAENFIKSYKYSSYYDYFVGDRTEKLILNKDAFPEHFSQLNDFEEIVSELSAFENRKG